MLVKLYLKKQLENLPEGLRGSIRQIEGLKSLARMRQLVCTSSNLFLSPVPVLDQYFAVQDQTPITKQQVLQVAGSLARNSHLPIFEAVARGAEKGGLPLREIEADVHAQGIIGKLDKTWYVLGEGSFMEEELFELGVTSQTIAIKMENQGRQILYLAQKQPKRLLAIFGCGTPLLENAAQAVQRLRELNVELILLTEQQTLLAKALGQSLGVQLIHSQLDEEEKKQIIHTLRENHPNVGVMGTPGTLSLDTNEGLKILLAKRMSASADVLLHSFSDLPRLIESARLILAKTRRRFFWCKI